MADKKLDTQLVNAGRSKKYTLGAVNSVIQRASSLVFDSVEAKKHATRNRANGELFYGRRGTLTHFSLQQAMCELEGSDDNEGIKERTSFRLERRVAAVGRQMGRGNGYLATIGAISPFVGLFGTVWGIMNSFIGIAQTQTTNLAVVAPGIAEALLATAIGLVAAIPAVVIYNVFARQIGGFKAMLGDVAAQVLLLQSRDLDLEASAAAHPVRVAQKLRAG